MKLDPAMWDKTPADVREVILRRALLGVSSFRREWLRPAVERHAESRLADQSEMLVRIKALWAAVLEKRSRRSAITPIRSVSR